jgi:hypothetical protein
MTGAYAGARAQGSDRRDVIAPRATVKEEMLVASEYQKEATHGSYR